MATYTLPTPTFDQEPFFSWVFNTPIVTGSFYVFKTSQGKLRVARILESTKALKGYDVKANLFIPFDEWQVTTRYPVADGLGKNLKEIVATEDIVSFNFDTQVHDIAFVFEEKQLFKHGAVLQGIDNAYVCRYLCDDTYIEGLSPFSSLIRDDDGIRVCPVFPCFPSRVFNDIERLRTRLYLDLNRKGELQGEFDRTYNPIPFSAESWMYFKYKLCGCLGVEWPRPVKQRIFKYRLDEGMSKTKYEIPMESVELIRIENEEDLGRLRSVLGTTICYGIRNDAPKLNCPATTINENDTLNIVVASTEAPDGFKRVLPAKYGGFDFVFDGTSTLFVRSRYKKVFYRTDKGTCVPIVEADGSIPQHFQVMLKDANWGYWNTRRSNRGNRSRIKVGDFFDHDGTMLEVLEVKATSIVAKLFFTQEQRTFHDKSEVASAIARKRGVEEIYN